MALFGFFRRKKPTPLKRLAPGTVDRKAAAPKRRKLIPQDITYEEAKTYARAPDRDVRSELASREDVQPELLYFLADDKDPEVRRSVAANNATPRQADLVLARDKDDDVRCDLALKIGRLIPGISQMQNERLQEVTLEVLGVLARVFDLDVAKLTALVKERFGGKNEDIVRNAMQAISSQNELRLGRISLRTRALRQFTIGHVRHRLVTKVEIIDNGPGIPADPDCAN